MLMAKPASVSVAKAAFEDLVTLGLIERTETNETSDRETAGDGQNSQTIMEQMPLVGFGKEHLVQERLARQLQQQVQTSLLFVS